MKLSLSILCSRYHNRHGLGRGRGLDHGDRANKRNAVKQLGMTLLEIMIVLAILTLVMGLLVGPRVFEMFGESKVKLAQTEVKQLAYEAYTQWQMNNNKACPDELTELTKYTNKKSVDDPWGKKYVMHCGENAPQGRSFGISSLGEDGKQGTEDDIKSWE